MRLIKLEVVHFGKLKQQIYPLDASFIGLFGINGSGKTTLFFFIRTILFGFPKKNDKDYIYQPIDSSLEGGKIWLQIDSEQDPILIERYRHHKQGQATVFFSDGTMKEESYLKTILEPLTLELFDQIYALSNTQINQRSFITPKKLQQMLLTIGVSGSDHFLKQISVYKKQQQSLFRPFGKKPKINESFEKLEYIEQQITKEQYKHHKDQDFYDVLYTLKEEYNALLHQEKELKQQLMRYQNQVSLWPQYELYQKIHQWMRYYHIENIEELAKYEEYQQQLDYYQKQQQQVNEKIVEISKQLLTDEEKIDQKLLGYVSEEDYQTLATWYEKETYLFLKEKECQEKIKENIELKTRYEQKLNQLEEYYPELLSQSQFYLEDKKPQLSYLSIILSVLSTLFGWILLSKPWHFVIWLVLSWSYIGIKLGQYYVSKKRAYYHFIKIRKKWAQLLNQLDQLYLRHSELKEEETTILVHIKKQEQIWQSMKQKYQWPEDMKQLSWPDYYKQRKHQKKLKEEMTQYQQQVETLQGRIQQKEAQLDTLEQIFSKLSMNYLSYQEIHELQEMINKYYDGYKTYTLNKCQNSYNKVQNTLNKIEQEKTRQEQVLEPYLKEEKALAIKQKELLKLYQLKEDQETVLYQEMKEWLKIQFKISLIKDMLYMLSDQQLPTVMSMVSVYFKMLTDHMFISCDIVDQEFTFYDTSNRAYSIEYLSTTQLTQFYLSLRLAIIFFYHQKIPAPLILDDIFVTYDEHKIKITIDLLKEFSQHTQVIILSSNYHLKKYFERESLLMYELASN